MQALLKDQQEALQRALELHANMVRVLASMESQAEFGIEALLPAISPSCSALPGALSDSQLGGSYMLNSPADDVSSKIGAPPRVPIKGLARWSPSKEVARHRGDSDATVSLADDTPPGSAKGQSHLNELSQPLLGLTEPEGTSQDSNWALSAHGKVTQIVEMLRGHFRTERRLVELAEQEVKKLEVDDLYHETGMWGSLLKNGCWQNTSFFVILANTLYIAIDTDYNKAPILCEAKPFFQVVSNAFCGFFVFELSTRFLALKQTHLFVQDKWFLFDLTLVMMLVWETWIQVFLYVISSGAIGGGTSVSYFSILRVFRVFRLVRALRSVPELMVLVCGMMSAMKSVLATVLLLFFTIYLFGIFFTQLLAGTDFGEGYFETVPQSMQFLLLQILCGADPDFMTKMHDGGWAYYSLWLCFLFLGQLTIMNMLIGVVCNAVDETTEEINNNEFVREVNKQVSIVISAADEDHNGTVSKEEFLHLANDQNSLKILYDLGVDLAGMKEYFENIYSGIDELPVTDVLDMVVQFRHSKATTVKDLLVLRRMILMELGQFEDRLNQATEMPRNGLGNGMSREASPCVAEA